MPSHPDTESVSQRFNGTPVLFELIPPPLNAEDELHQNRLELLHQLFSETKIGALNLPEVQEESQKDEQGQRRSDFTERFSPREYVTRLRESFPDISYVINRVIVKHDRETQSNWLQETYHEYNIENIVLVGGESSDIDYPGPSVTEGNRLVKEEINADDSGEQTTNFRVGNICIASRRQKSLDEPERMTKKIRAGADFFTTQIVFEEDHALQLMEDLSRKLDYEKIAPPFLFWSLSPVSEQKDIDFLRWLGVKISEETEDMLLEDPETVQASTRHAKQIWEKIQAKNDELAVPFPLGINISFMGERNFKNAIHLTRELEKITNAPIC